MAENNALNSIKSLSIGLDPFFNVLDSFIATSSNQQPFPPYTTVQVNEYTFIIELALAGYAKEDVEITVKEDLLSITGSKKQKTYGEPEKSGYTIFPKVLHNGISFKTFTKNFALAENMEVKNASFENGLLVIKLEQSIPEEKKLKTIHIK